MIQETYTGSCNPARRAKQISRTNTTPVKKTTPVPSDAPRNILPLPTRNGDGLCDDTTPDTSPQPGPAKRGRKPGPLSRSARETQRKLNHSIIEKARRTKINDALATLRQLVPADYGDPKTGKNDDETEEEDWDGRKKQKPKKSTKREVKEKEFKLEILVRTVSFMQDLLTRVQVLEEGTGPAKCPKCAQGPTSKRRHDQVGDELDQARGGPAKRSRRESTASNVQPTKYDVYQIQHPSSPEFASRPYLGARLPPISSWLPNSEIDPVLLSPNQRRLSDSVTQLPSPPSSTHFDPIQTSHIPPVLNLGPIATSHLLSPHRTPEDESAASLLLQISGTSPQVLPVTTSIPSITSFDMSKMRTSCMTPVDYRIAQFAQAQTPGSMLGLVRRG